MQECFLQQYDLPALGAGQEAPGAASAQAVTHVVATWLAFLSA